MRTLLSFSSAYSRKRFVLAISGVLLVALVGWALPNVSHAAFQDTEELASKIQKPASVSGEILVRFRANATAATSTPKLGMGAAMSVEDNGSQFAVRVERLSAGPEIVTGLRIARVAPEETERAIEALRKRPDVIYAEPNYIHRKSVVPHDTFYGDQWSLKNTGQSGGVVGADIDAELAWNTTTGSRDVVVAVIDEGIDVSHPDLQANIWRNPGEIQGNGIDDDGNGYVDDLNGYDFFNNDATVFDGPGTNPHGTTIDAHGTHVAGTIGATGNNSLGVVGVNWQVSLMSLKFLGPDGGTTADLLKALAYAKMMRDLWVSSGGVKGANIRVTNNSYGGGSFSQSESDAIQAIGASGILFVAAAGNDAQDNNIIPSFPASYNLPNVITVAATDRGDNLAGFSNRGSRTVHLGAPGSSILSTTPGNTYSSYSGTSMASPHVAGTAALVLAAHPNFTVPRLRASLLFGGDPIASLNQTTLTGRRLNAAGSLQNAAETDSAPPAIIGNLAITSQDERNVTLNWTAPGDDGNSGQASLYEISFVDQVTTAKFLLAVKNPQTSGSTESINLNVPYRHAAGSFLIHTIDNVGNTSDSSVSVLAGPSEAVDPYTISTGPATPLSTGGIGQSVFYDDYITGGYGLPFNFPFFDKNYSNVFISSNGALYFGNAPRHDAFNSTQALNGAYMIAGAWSDLDLRICFRADSDVYRVQPDPDRVIFRWQGVKFTSLDCPSSPTGQDQVNFEIELRRDGTIQKRYGQNTPLNPVVGIGGGEPEGYVIASHTSESTPIDLTNAATITYTLRRLPPSADWQRVALTAAQVDQLKAWTLGGRTYVYVKPQFPDAGYRVVDWGPVGRSSNDFTVDASVLKFTGAAIQSVVTTAQIYDLGPLADGTYNFNFKTSGTLAKTLQFLVTSATPPPNPIDTAREFVRQQYRDFLNREADQAGEDFWTDNITLCSNPARRPAGQTEAQCTLRQRTTTSGAFFLSPEFQYTGYFVYRMYQGALGRQPKLSEFTPDAQFVGAGIVINGQLSGAKINQNKTDFAQQFVNCTDATKYRCAEFKARYDGLNNEQYVDKLFETTGVNVNPSDRAALVDGLNASQPRETRATVLQKVVDGINVISEGNQRFDTTYGQAFYNAESNRAFVQLQYFGYMKRDPDDAGYAFWLGKLNQFGGNFVNAEMVLAFISSPEYRARFGQP